MRFHVRSHCPKKIYFAGQIWKHLARHSQQQELVPPHNSTCQWPLFGVRTRYLSLAPHSGICRAKSNRTVGTVSIHVVPSYVRFPGFRRRYERSTQATISLAKPPVDQCGDIDHSGQGRTPRQFSAHWHAFCRIFVLVHAARPRLRSLQLRTSKAAPNRCHPDETRIRRGAMSLSSMPRGGVNTVTWFPSGCN